MTPPKPPVRPPLLQGPSCADYMDLEFAQDEI